MQLISILKLSLVAATTLVGAAPAPYRSNFSADDLLKRADPAPVSCGPLSDLRAWPLESIRDAFNALVANGNLPRNDRPKAGTRAYPQQYGNNAGIPTDASVSAALDAIPGCETGQGGKKYFEFPLTDPVFAGGDPRSQGPDRVIAIAPNVGPGENRMFTYCLAITHRGGTGPNDPSFRPCV